MQIFPVMLEWSMLLLILIKGHLKILKFRESKCASAGNWTRASRVAGENSTTEPPMLHEKLLSLDLRSFSWIISHLQLKNLKLIQNSLPGRELNPGLPRDRRGYSPLYYQGLGYNQLENLRFWSKMAASTGLNRNFSLNLV